MASTDVGAVILSLQAPGLARAAGVFLLLAFGSWGLGDVIVGAFRVPRVGDSRFLRPLLALAVGCGALGEGLFIAGVIGDAYQSPLVGSVLVALAVLAAFRLRVRGLGVWLRPPKHLGVYGWAVVVLAVVYLGRWAWVSLGFNPGSDVFSHHYVDVKAMIRERHFAYAPHIPSGLGHISSYNPALARMLWLPGHLLADERAANMFHWLTQVMLMGALYVFGRCLLSARAGLFAVALYLTTGMMGYFPLEAQDYTLMAVFMVLAMFLVIVDLRDGSRPALILGGVLAGLMLSTKYYAFPIAGLMVAAIAFWEPRTWRTRIRTALVFAAIAFLIYAPWFLYNSINFHDPFFPFSLQNEEMRFDRATYWVHTLSPFVVASDRGFFLPTAFYYLSLFVPIDPASAVFDLSVMFLIALPCSLYYLLRGRGVDLRTVNVLFVLSVLSFVSLHVFVGHLAFYKWAFFPAVLYTSSFGILVERLRPGVAHAFWVATLVTTGMNYWFVAAPQIEKITPPVAEQQVRWNEMTRYLNTTLEPDAVISGTDSASTYYLRADLVGLPEDDMTSTDWHGEESVIRRAGVKYMLVAPSNQATYDMLYKRWSGLWRQLSAHDTSQAEYIEDVQHRAHERNRQQADFLTHFGTLVHESTGGVQLYRLR